MFISRLCLLFIHNKNTLYILFHWFLIVCCYLIYLLLAFLILWFLVSMWLCFFLLYWYWNWIQMLIRPVVQTVDVILIGIQIDPLEKGAKIDVSTLFPQSRRWSAHKLTHTIFNHRNSFYFIVISYHGNLTTRNVNHFDERKQIDTIVSCCTLFGGLGTNFMLFSCYHWTLNSFDSGNCQLMYDYCYYFFYNIHSFVASLINSLNSFGPRYRTWKIFRFKRFEFSLCLKYLLLI